MVIAWNQIINLLPILIVGLTVIVMMLSIACSRNHVRHALLAVIGLSLSAIVLLNMNWKYIDIHQDINSLMYIDNFTVLYMVLIIILSIASSISGYTWLLRYPTQHRDEFYLLLLISSMGGMLLITANHLIMLFLGIELLSLPLLGLISYIVFEKCSIKSSIKYIILSGVSSAFLLFGIALIYAETGSLSFFDIKEILTTAHHFNSSTSFQFMLLIITGLIMMMVSFGFKLSFVPFHSWAPDIYQVAPSVVIMYLTNSSKIAVISILMKFLSIFPKQYHDILYIFLLGSSCCSMLFGSIVAIQQNNIKKILAYSSITSSGYLLIPLITSSIDYTLSQEAAGIYLINYLFSNVGIFGIIVLMSSVSSIDRKTDHLLWYRGLFWKEPMLSIIFTIIMLSLAGMPITFGFIGKFYLLLIGINNQLWTLTIFIIISSIISLLYYLKIIINLYLSPTNNNDFNNNFSYNFLYSPTGVIVLIMTIGIIVFGLYPRSIIYLIHFCI